jgi:nucleotide-binding universal stress UspA family protein
MYKTIVLGLDGSDGSSRAVPHAVELAKAGGGRIVAVHVEEQLVGKGAQPGPAEEEARSAARSQVEEIEGSGVEVSLDSRSIALGGPGQVIAEVAEEVDADLVVVGTRGHSSIPGLVLGSVAHRLIHLAHRPVLAVPPPD